MLRVERMEVMSKFTRLLVALPRCATPGADKKIVSVRRMPFAPFQEVSRLEVPVDTPVVAVDVVVDSEIDISVVAQNSAGDQSAPMGINLIAKDPLPPSLVGGVEICGAEEVGVVHGDADLRGLDVYREEAGVDGDAGPG